MLDIERRELRRGGELLRLEPQVFDLLAYLVQHRDRVVGKDDLLEAVWGGRSVSDSALTTRINAARRVLGDNGERQRLIRTLPRKGIRFVGEVDEASNGGGLGPAVAVAEFGATPMPPDKPSIAVLAFANIGGDPAQEHFADGMVEEIITALSRIRWLFVIARSSSFTYKGQVVDVKRVGRELGVRYVLDGSVRKSGDRVRIGAQLLDAETGMHLWADRFDGALDDIFELQDRVAISVAGVIEPTMEAVEMHRSAQRPTNDLTAHDFYLRALPVCYSCDAPSLRRAQELLERAIERDPNFGPALATAAGCHQFLGCSGWADDPEANRAEAVDLARRALQADGNDPIVLTEAARVLGYFTEELESAIAMIERALALNPSHARGWYWNGWVRLFAGEPDMALEHFRTALRLNPRHRPYMTGIGVARFFGRRYAEAIQALLASLDEVPGWPTTYRFLAASYAQLGQLEKARETFERLQAITPALAAPADCSGTPPFRSREQLALYREGLRLAAEAA
jgi:TolB-like protein/tetratricopeptide (TPR) repeat protein